MTAEQSHGLCLLNTRKMEMGVRKSAHSQLLARNHSKFVLEI